MEILNFDFFHVQRKYIGKNLNYPLKFLPQIFVSGKQHFWNQHIKIVLESEFTVLYSQMSLPIVTCVLQDWSLTIFPGIQNVNFYFILSLLFISSDIQFLVL